MKTVLNAFFALSIIAGVVGSTVTASQAFDAKSFYAEQDRGRF